MKKKILKALIYLYLNYKKSNFLKNLIKKGLGKDKIVTRYNDFFIRTGVVSAIESNIIFDIYNETAILNIISKYAKKGFNFIDIGANIGLHSLTASKSNPDIEIFSFEPEPNNFSDFIKNISLNDFKNVRPFNIGLGDKKSVEKLYINEGWNKGKHSLKQNVENTRKTINIPILKLDDFSEIIDFENLIIKIDVEGFEKEVIEGGQTILKNSSNTILIIELIQEINGLETCEKIFEILKKIGFVGLYKFNNENDLIEVSEFSGSSDYMFLKGVVHN